MYKKIESSDLSLSNFNGKFKKIGKLNKSSRSYVSELMNTKVNNENCLQLLEQEPFDIYIRNYQPCKSAKNKKFVIFTEVLHDSEQYFRFKFLKYKNSVEYNVNNIKKFIKTFHSDVFEN